MYLGCNNSNSWEVELTGDETRIELVITAPSSDYRIYAIEITLDKSSDESSDKPIGEPSDESSGKL